MEEKFLYMDKDDLNKKSKNILFVTYFFAPYNSIGGLRNVKTAKYLSRLGNTVDVLTANEQPLQKNLPLEDINGDVIYTRWLNVNAPVEFFSGGRSKVASKGYLMGRGKWNIISKLGKLYKDLFNFPDGQIGWYPFALSKGKKLVEQRKYDLIYASAWPITSLLVASKLSKKYKIPMVCEFRDLWTRSPYFNVPVWRRVIEQKLEKRVLEQAVGLVTVSDPLAAQLKQLITLPTKVITNGFDRSDIPESKNKKRFNGKVKIIHTGTIYVGKRNPAILFEALSRFRGTNISFEVEFYGRYTSSLQETVNHFELQDCVRLFENVAYKRSLKEQSESDLFLLLLWNDEQEKGSFTGKFFEYIGSQKPIIALGPKSNVASQLIQANNIGWVCSSLQEVEDLLLQLNQDYVKQLDSKSYKVEDFMQYSRQGQTKKLNLFFDELLDV